MIVKKNINKLKTEINIKKDGNSFVFKYNSIYPALSIICLNKHVLNTPYRFKWISELCVLFNISMDTSIYKINEIDLTDPDKWFNKIFGYNSFKNADRISNNPLLWGKYIWALLHIVSLFWTEKTNKIIVYLLENVNYILPCLECQKHYSEYIINNRDRLNKFTSLSTAVNFVIDIREKISVNKKYNRVPEGNYCFLEIYNYILPLVEPSDTVHKTTGSKCNCNKTLLKFFK
jgi:hypothetical protein